MSIISQTREWVNEQRARIGLRALSVLPRGIKGNEEECVIARALVADLKPEPNTRLSVRVDGSVAVVQREYLNEPVYEDDFGYAEYRVEDILAADLPEFAQEFISKFDAGEIQKLVEV